MTKNADVEPESYRTTEPRKTRELLAQCFAPEAMFTAEWSDIPREFQLMYENKDIPCEGGGVPGEWCRNCPFGELEEEIVF